MDGSSLLNPHSSTLDEGPLWPEACDARWYREKGFDGVVEWRVRGFSAPLKNDSL
jgi:hypothetical protein